MCRVRKREILMLTKHCKLNSRVCHMLFPAMCEAQQVELKPFIYCSNVWQCLDFYVQFLTNEVLNHVYKTHEHRICQLYPRRYGSTSTAEIWLCSCSEWCTITKLFWIYWRHRLTDCSRPDTNCLQQALEGPYDQISKYFFTKRFHRTYIWPHK